MPVAATLAAGHDPVGAPEVKFDAISEVVRTCSNAEKFPTQPLKYRAAESVPISSELFSLLVVLASAKVITGVALLLTYTRKLRDEFIVNVINCHVFVDTTLFELVVEEMAFPFVRILSAPVLVTVSS